MTCLNISLDSLQRAKFEEITGVDGYGLVRAGIDACLDAGMRVKINVVALKGINDDELPEFVDFARDLGVDVRFIEFMPIGYQSRWSRANYWPAKDIVAAVALYRPGPLGAGMVDDYIDRKHGRAPIAYPHPKLEVYRASCGQPPLGTGDAQVEAVATDEPAALQSGLPVLSLDDTESVLDFILSRAAPDAAVPR